MEEYYGKINALLDQIKLQNESMDEEMGKMKQIQTLLQKKELFSDSRTEENTSKWVERYMKSIKNRYDSLKTVSFCDDYAVNAVLSHFYERCEKNDIITDFLLQEYHRDHIKEEDILYIFRPLIKKYDGILEIHREDETLEILLGLTDT